MQIIRIKRGSERKSALKVYAKILGDSGLAYSIGYIVRRGFRGWVCTCESFVFTMFKKNRNCKHIRHVRNLYGRYGSKVAKDIATA